MRPQEIRNFKGHAQLVEGDQKVFERELAKMRNIMMEKDRRIQTAEDLICKQKEVIEELTDIQKQSEDAAMNEMHGYMNDTKTQDRFYFQAVLMANNDQIRRNQRCSLSVLVQISSRVWNFSSPDSNLDFVWTRS